MPIAVFEAPKDQAYSDALAARVQAFSKPVLAPIYSSPYLFTAYNLLPNPDEILKTESHGNVGFYRQVRQQNPHFAGSLKRRIDACLALPHIWLPGDPDDDESVAASQTLSQAWANLPDIFAAMRQLLFAIADGYSIGELIYDLAPFEASITLRQRKAGAVAGAIDGQTIQMVKDSSGKFVPADDQSSEPEQGITKYEQAIIVPRIVDRRPENFKFDLDGKLRFLAPLLSPQGVPVDRLKAIIGRYGSADLYGDGETREAYPNLFLIDTITKFGLTALEKQGYPLLKVEYPERWDADRTAQLKRAYTQTYPNVIFVPLPIEDLRESFPDREVRNTLIGDDQLKRIQSLNDDNDLLILGATQSTNNSAHGDKGSTGVKADTTFEKTPGDAAVYDSLANQWRDVVCDINFPSLPKSKRPQMYTDTKPTPDLVAWINAATAAAALGYPVSKKQVGKVLTLDEAQSEEDTLRPAPKALPSAPIIPAQGGAGNQQNDGAVTVLSESGEMHTFKSVAEFREVFGV